MDEFGENTASREHEWWSGSNARVFVSCGQASDKERSIASDIGNVLRGEGFAVYLGIQTHSSMGLNENIYRHLTTAEYVVFVDFPDRPADYHFSLFSHQEMAIGSFVGADLLAFHPSGKKPEGVLKFMQGNSIPFEDPEELPKIILKNVKDEGWNRIHRRELRLEVTMQPPATAEIPSDFLKQIPAGVYRYFELVLKNLHSIVMATDCTVQIVGARGPSFARRSNPDIIEMKFRYMVKPSIVLPPGRGRQLDGVVVRATPGGDGFMPLACPGILNPGHIDSEQIVAEYLMRDPGEYELDLEMHSREFGTQRATIFFHFDSDPERCSISVASRPGSPDPGMSTGAATRLDSPTTHQMETVPSSMASGVMPTQPGTVLPQSPMPHVGLPK